jgi:multidrug efflux pump
MTSLCTAFGAIPLMLASGAGAEARQAIGVSVFYGVIISVVLTLAVVPAVYTLVAKNTQSPQTIAKLIERLRGSTTDKAGPRPPPGTVEQN